MNFAQPLWLVTGLAICIGLAFFFRFMHKKRMATLEKFAAHQLVGQLTRNVSSRKRRSKNIFLLLAVFMCFAALARPQYGSKWVEVKRKGIDLLFALDTSKSMLAEDIKPNRLKRAHLAILDFVRQLDGDRVGLLPFAGSAYLMCPMTLDYDAFENSLSAVTTDIIPKGGTNIAAVITEATETLSNAANHKILIILTDGEHLQGDTIKVAEEAAAKGLTIYTVGVGTSEGELIPLPEKNGSGFIKDTAGNFVTSKLDEATLSQIAEVSEGLYVPLGMAGEGLETIYQEKLTLIPKDELAERRTKIPIDRFEWPLALAFFFLVVEVLIGQRKSNGRFSIIKVVRRRFGKATTLTACILLLSFGQTAKSYASAGEEAYHQGDYLKSSEYYLEQLEKKSDDPVLQYNYGTSAYKNNMMDDAIAAFSNALKSADINLQEKSYFNRGNSYYRKGAEVVQGDPKAAVELWKQALESLDSALKLDPDRIETKNNYEIVKKQLEELERQQQKENEQQDQDQQKNQDEQNNDGKQKQQNDESKQDMNEDQASGGEKEQTPGQEQQKPVPDDENQAADETGKASASEKDDKAEEQAAKDAIRQEQGKMTKEEAEQLLNALKNEEGELNFVPGGRSNDNEVDRDW